MGARTWDENELGPDEEIPEWTKKEWKDPTFAKSLRRWAAISTPCHAAWRVPAYRAAIYSWLSAAPLSPALLILPVMMPERTPRDAIFERRLLLWRRDPSAAGVRLYVAVDSISGAIFAARRFGTMRTLLHACAIAFAATLGACSLTIRADRIEGRASLFAGANRETKQDVESTATETLIVAGLIAEMDGRDELARAYLAARGYSVGEIDRRLALAKVKPAAVIVKRQGE